MNYVDFWSILEDFAKKNLRNFGETGLLLEDYLRTSINQRPTKKSFLRKVLRPLWPPNSLRGQVWPQIWNLWPNPGGVIIQTNCQFSDPGGIDATKNYSFVKILSHAKAEAWSMQHHVHTTNVGIQGEGGMGRTQEWGTDRLGHYPPLRVSASPAPPGPRPSTFQPAHCSIQWCRQGKWAARSMRPWPTMKETELRWVRWWTMDIENNQGAKNGRGGGRDGSGIRCQSNPRLTGQQEHRLTFIIILLIAVILSNRFRTRSINQGVPFVSFLGSNFVTTAIFALSRSCIFFGSWYQKSLFPGTKT